MDKRLLAIDIGGTAIKYAIFQDGLRGTEQIPTPYESLEALINDLKGIVDKVGPIDGIGVSMPGTIDTKTGMVYQGGSLTYNAGVNFKEVLQEATGLPVSIFNDAKSATLAELHAGVLKGVSDGVVILFGTGIGGGIVTNGKILNGAHLQAGEFSFLDTNLNKSLSWDNIVGTELGSVGLSKDVEKASGLAGLNGIEIFKEIRAGNGKVLEGVKTFCDRATMLFYNMQYTVDPEIIAIGGGISAEPMFMDLLNESLDKLFQDFQMPGQVRPNVKVCTHRNDANLLGAVYGFIDQHPEG